MILCCILNKYDILFKVAFVTELKTTVNQSGRWKVKSLFSYVIYK